jgi:transcriptional regulator with XRE-family HTH domain
MTTETFDALLANLKKDASFAEEQERTKPSRELAMLLVQVRRTLKLSQAQFAKNAGVSQAYISQLESGTANPSIQKVTALLRRNGVSFEMQAVVSARRDRGESAAQLRVG